MSWGARSLPPPHPGSAPGEPRSALYPRRAGKGAQQRAPRAWQAGHLSGLLESSAAHPWRAGRGSPCNKRELSDPGRSSCPAGELRGKSGTSRIPLTPQEPRRHLCLAAFCSLSDFSFFHLSSHMQPNGIPKTSKQNPRTF